MTTPSQPHPMELQDLAGILADRFDITQSAAQEAAEIHLGQIEKEDNRSIDRDAIGADDVEFVTGCVATTIEDVSARPLDLVSDAADRMAKAHHDRDAAIRDAAAAGVPKARIADAARLGRAQIYNIISA
jgi:hypothetical protein